MLVDFFLILIFIFFSFGQLGRLSFFNQSINFYLYEVLMAIFFFFLLFKLKLLPLKKIFKNRFLFFSFGYFLFSFFFSFFNYYLFENLVSFLYLFRLYFYFLFFLYLYYYQKDVKNLKEVVLFGFLLFSLLTIITSFLQVFLYPNLRNLAYLGWDVHYNRAFGLFFDTSVSATVYGFLFFFWLIFNKKKYLIFLPFLLFLLFYTYSRWLIFSFLITSSFYFLKNKEPKKIFFILLLLFFFLLLFPQKSGIGVGIKRFFSIESRIKENILGIRMGLKNPLFGIGYNRIRFFRQRNNLLWQSDFNIHHGASSFQSTYTTIFVASGIFGLLFFIKIIFLLLKQDKKFFYPLFFVCLGSLADNLLLHPFILFSLGSIFIIFDKKP